MTQSSDENYLTTAEVADRLKVKPETIYAYVSRGLLTSRRARGRRGSLFAEADVERLASRSVDHPGAIERIESKLTLLTDDELYYRGRPVRDLATTQTVESVARLLWSDSPGPQALVEPFPAPREGVELARAAMAVAPAGARLTDKLRIAVAVLGAGDPLRFDLAPHSVEVAASRLLGVLVTALPGPAGKGSFGGRLWPKLSTKRPARPELLDAAVILLADHGLAVSTVAARVAASARANLYAVVSAGLGALDGHLHGAATTLAYEFLGRALEEPVRALSDQLRSGEPVPGFGHKVYQNRDPRAEVLLELLGDTPVVETVQSLTAQVPGFPNSDLAVAAMMHAHNFRPDAGEALFALARIIGWTAHALEEYAQPALRFRAEGIYTGHTTQTT
jgi:citrate synthase